MYEAAFVGLMLLAGIPAASSLEMAIGGRVIQLACWAPWWLAQVAGARGVRPPSRDPVSRSSARAR